MPYARSTYLLLEHFEIEEIEAVMDSEVVEPEVHTSS
jgi:hypothetical protein